VDIIHLYSAVQSSTLFRVAYPVQRPCSDFADTLRRLISCRIIIIISESAVEAVRFTTEDKYFIKWL